MGRFAGLNAVNELYAAKVFDKPIIAYHKSTYKNGRDLVHPPILAIGRNRLGSLFGRTWRQCLKAVYRRDCSPIEVIENSSSIRINLPNGGSIFLEDNTRLTKIEIYDDQVTLCILGKDRNLDIIYSVFFDNPLSGLIVDTSKVEKI